MSDTHELKLIWPDTQPSEVIATGTFDKWSSSVRLAKSPQGFTGSVQVPWGEKVLFKFVVDGRWRTLESELTERDWIGNVNNVYKAPPKPPVVEEPTVDAAPSADAGLVSIAAATDGTTSFGQYIASGVGEALKGIIGVDPINSEPIPLATPKAEVEEPATVIEPIAPAPVAPIVPVELSPVNNAANNTISPVNGDEVHTHGPVIMPRRVSAGTPTERVPTPTTAPAEPLGPTKTFEPLVNGGSPSAAVVLSEALVNGGDSHTHNPVVMPRRVSPTTTPAAAVPAAAEPVVHAHTNGNGNGSLKAPEPKKDEETTPKAAPIVLEEPPIVLAEEPLPTKTEEPVAAKAEELVATKAEEPVTTTAEQPAATKAEEPVAAEEPIATEVEEPTTPKAKEASLKPTSSAPSTPAKASPTTRASAPSTPVRASSSHHQFPSESPTPSSLSRFSTITSATRKKRHSFFGKVKSLFDKSPKKE